VAFEMVKLLPSSGRASPARAVAAALAAPAGATLLALSLGPGEARSAASIYLLAVVVAAALGGLWSGLAGAALGFLALNFFFTAPRHTFRVGKPEDLVALFVFLIVAAIVGSLLARALEERARATRRERETRLLNYFATKLLSGEPLERVLNDFAAALLDPFGLARCEIRAWAGVLSIDARSARADAVEGPMSRVPLSTGSADVGELIAVRRAGTEPLGGADLQLLEACAKQVAVAIERHRSDAQVEGARLNAETNQLRAALFSAVTHDLRTPLASIMTSVTSLLDESATLDAGQERELLRTVLEETDRLNRLVGNILELARVRAGALVPAKESTAVDEVVESVLHRMQPRLTGVVVRTIMRPDAPEIPVDPVQLDQVVTNLLENATRFSPPGGEITISVSPWQRSMQVRVADQGPGIPPDERERVFDAFYRGDATNGRGGSGLGLAIARAIVLAHGGRIWIEGSPSGGTAVVFELPMTDAEPARQEPSP
jgi:two-component system sensor histidine kinase KdpD